MTNQPSDMNGDAFRAAGHRLIDALADFYESLPERRVTRGDPAAGILELLPPGPLPASGQAAGELLERIAPILFDHSLHNGHPRFFGYITSSAAPIGALADLLAAGINANCGLRDLSPAANEIEHQAVQWLAELIGYPVPCGGIMVSGGNMANMLGFFAARRAKLGAGVRETGLAALSGRSLVYASSETHTWLQKAADLAGIGTDSIRWIATDAMQRVDPGALGAQIRADRAAGERPFLVIGTAGNVSTGAVDPLADIAAIAAAEDLWFHVDGAYGAPAACLPEAEASLQALALADSVALDPHKWLYAPIEAACTLVRDPAALRDAFSFRPPYYRLDDDADAGGPDYFEHGPQNTRGFRALKVWLGLQQAGREGYVRQIRRNVALASHLFDRARATDEIEAGTHHLSITTFRFRPAAASGKDDWPAYLDELNRELLTELQRSGDVYVSNAVIGGHYYLRACVVNFRSTEADVEFLLDAAVRLGREIDARRRPGDQ